MSYRELDRREWVRTSARWAFGLLFAGIAAHLGIRWLRAGCPQSQPQCHDCVLLVSCSLPPAQKTKRQPAS